MISYKTLTHCRVHLLEEALYSFLLQSPDIASEMIIVNDYPLQKLVFDHPRVKIYNLDKTFPIIGQKENYAIERCSGDIIVTGDDDDIALPNHFSNIIKYWNEWGREPDIMFWGNAVYYNEPNITALIPVGNSGMVFSKQTWEKVGKSPIKNSGGDRIFVNKIKQFGHIVHAYPPNEEISWFYRWATPLSSSGLGCYHSSGQGDDTPEKPNIVQRNSKYIESQRIIGRVPTGEIELKPKWRHDYQKMLNDFIKKK